MPCAWQVVSIADFPAHVVRRMDDGEWLIQNENVAIVSCMQELAQSLVRGGKSLKSQLKMAKTSPSLQQVTGYCVDTKTIAVPIHSMPTHSVTVPLDALPMMDSS